MRTTVIRSTREDIKYMVQESIASAAAEEENAPGGVTHFPACIMQTLDSILRHVETVRDA